MKIVGLEIHDLLFVLLLASVMNLIFGRTALAIYLVFLLPAALALILFFTKRNKPDRYLIHWFRYYLSPGFYSAAETPVQAKRLRSRITDSPLAAQKERGFS